VSVFHSVYGLRIRSNRPIPGLVPESEPAVVDLTVHLEQGRDRLASPSETLGTGEWTDERDDQGWRMWRTDRGHYRICYSDGTDFVIGPGGTSISATWNEPLTLEDTATYLLGPVLRRVLGLRGVLCLHGSAVVIDGGAVVLAGPRGAGKSTTAAALAARGMPVLSDDLVALVPNGHEFLVQPGYRLVRLWPDVSEAVCGRAGALPLLTPNWDKRFLALTDEIFAPAPVPLSAIYLLSDARSDDDAPLTEAVAARDALMGLVANSRSEAPHDSSLLANEYRLLGRVRQAVSIRRLVPHESLGRLQRLCDVIEQDVRATASGLASVASVANAGALL
jgi:hypothetical protein